MRNLPLYLQLVDQIALRTVVTPDSERIVFQGDDLPQLEQGLVGKTIKFFDLADYLVSGYSGQHFDNLDCVKILINRLA
jgi:hypothetical protein